MNAGNVWARAQSWLRAVGGSMPMAHGRTANEMDEEIRFHLEERAADLARSGLSPREAMRQAKLEFGAVATHKDGMRRSLGLGWWDALWADLRYGARILRNSPGFTAIAVLSLALAISANTTIFSLANEVLFAQLGVPHPEQLRVLQQQGDEHFAVHSSWGQMQQLPGGGTLLDVFSYPIYQQLKHDNRALQDLFAFKESVQANVTASGQAQAVRLSLVSGNFYQQLGVRPRLGRPILPSDDSAPATGAVATLSDGFWKRAFGASPDVVGKVITVNMTRVTVIGVNPPSFTGANSVQSSPELFMPLSMISLMRAPIGNNRSNSSFFSDRSLAWVQIMARTRPGVTDEQARLALDLALKAAVRNTMTVKKGETLPRLRLPDGSRGENLVAQQYAKSIYVLLALVGLVLMLACANIANLMLARASARQREMGVRLALGAGRGRVLRQVLTESLMLSAMGGVLGLILGYLGRSVLPRLLLNPWERQEMQVPFDWRVFAFTAVVTLATGLFFGLVPAWRATHAEIGTVLKEGGKTASRRRKAWSSKAIVTFQVAVSTLLVVSAGLFLRTLINLNSVHAGFRTDHLVLFDVNPPSKQYPAPKDVALHARLEETLRAIPGVDGLTTTDVPLLANSRSNSSFILETPTKAQSIQGENASAFMANVGRGFFKVAEIPIIAGRSFTAADARTPRRLAIINQALAHTFFAGQNPIGQRFKLDDRPQYADPIEIVGVCADTLYADLRQPAPPIHFDLYNAIKEVGGMTYMVRTRASPASLVPALRAAVQKVDPDLPLVNVRTQQEQIDGNIQQERMFASLSAGFGVLALALACVGIYGIMAYTVSQRTNEIGIRLALGARRAQVQSMVLREAGWLTITGVIAGVGAALLLGRLVGTMLYGLKPADPLTLACAAALLLTVALLAGWAPALRASHVQPMEALRHD